MIDTAGSIYNLARELSGKAGSPVNIMVVHPVFSNPAIERIHELKRDGVLGRLVVCDTIDTRDLVSQMDFMEVIESADLSARITLGISQNRQMADLIDIFSPEDYLLSREDGKRRP
jgi:ribose-phosphate pyrophosphokinase